MAFTIQSVTDAGRTAMQLALDNNYPLIFTSIKSGNGAYEEGEDVAGRTALKSLKNTFVIGSREDQEHSVKLGAVLTNYDGTSTIISTGYKVNEIGLFCTVNGTEYLYALAAAPDDSGRFLPGYDGTNLTQIVQTWTVALTNDAEIQVEMTTAYALATDMSIANTDIPWYGTSSSAASTVGKTATTSDGKIASLIDGVKVRIKFTNGNTAANPTLNVDGRGAKSIKAYGSTVPTLWWKAGDVVDFTYDGTNWLMGTGIQEDLKAAVDGKVETSAIANNLTTTTEGYVLDARQGKALDEGKLSTTGNSANNTVAYTSADDASVFNSGNLGGQSAYGWTATAKIATGEKHSVLFNKVSTMFKNIRTIAKLIGTTDISAVGDGTISNAISSLNSDLSELNNNKIGYYGNDATLLLDRNLYSTNSQHVINPYTAPADGVLVGSIGSKGLGFSRLLLDGSPCWIGGYGATAYKDSNGIYQENFIVFMKEGQVLSSDGQTQQSGTTYIGIFRAYFIPMS